MTRTLLSTLRFFYRWHIYRWYTVGVTTRSTPAVRHTFVPPEPPRTPKSAGTRRRLLDIACRLFVERGYSAVSMSDIAATAGLTKGALYGHFRSKGQLLVETIRWLRSTREHQAAFTEALADPERAAGLFFDEEGRDMRLLQVDAAAAARHDLDVAAGLAELHEERQQRLRRAVAHTHDPDTAAWVISALGGGIGLKEASRLPMPDADRLRAALLAAQRGVVELTSQGGHDANR